MPTADQKLFPCREPPAFGGMSNNRNKIIWEGILRSEAKATRKWEQENTCYGPVDTVEKSSFAGLEKSMLVREGYFKRGRSTGRKRPATTSGKRTARPKGVPEGYVWSNVLGGFGGSVGPLNMSQVPCPTLNSPERETAWALISDSSERHHRGWDQHSSHEGLR